jgi:hypothetical protein
MKIRLTNPQKKVLGALPLDGSILSDPELARRAFGAISSAFLNQTLSRLVKRGLISGSEKDGWALTLVGLQVVAAGL